MRVVIADDVMLIRSGLSRLLVEAGVDVVGEAADAEGLLRLVALEGPDAAVVDIRMPPTHTDEGLVAARSIRALYPRTAVVVLSQYLEPHYAQRLLAQQPEGLGYVLKERVSEIEVLVDALRRVVAGECVLDPSIVEAMVARTRHAAHLAGLSEREFETLSLLARGLSNTGVAAELGIGERTVESTCAVLFRKLGLAQSSGTNRRVLAVLTLLNADQP